jgi:hypothetical protein
MTEKHTYKPRFGSFTHFVITFFLDNPEEELTVDDMATKWPEVKRNSIHSILGPVVLHEILERGKNGDGEYFYKAGQYIARADICQPVGESDMQQAVEAEAAGAPHEFRVDMDVPLPTKYRHQTYGKWKPMFAALTMKGQSIVIAAEDAKRIKSTAQKMRQTQKGAPPHFHVGQDEKGAWRVWRTA